MAAYEAADGRIYSMIDLFAGCGGLSLGFEKAEFTPVFVNELDKDALGTYLLNRHHDLGGEDFAENEALRCNDAHELKGKGLDRLVSDLSNISEIDFRFDGSADPSSGGEARWTRLQADRPAKATRASASAAHTQ